MEISDLTDAITPILNSCMDWVSIVIGKISEEPLLLLTILLPFVSIGIAILKKLLSVKS